MKKILIEGPDCSGKSTLVERLKNTLRWDAKHLHHQKGNQFERYLSQYATNNRTILDRGHISEAVYGQLWRGGNPFSKNQYKILNSILKEFSFVIFTCPTISVLKKRYQERDFDQQIKLEELEKSKELFAKEMKDINHLKYYSKDFLELNRLIEIIEKELIK